MFRVTCALIASLMCACGDNTATPDEEQQDAGPDDAQAALLSGRLAYRSTSDDGTRVKVFDLETNTEVLAVEALREFRFDGERLTWWTQSECRQVAPGEDPVDCPIPAPRDLADVSDDGRRIATVNLELGVGYHVDVYVDGTQRPSDLLFEDEPDYVAFASDGETLAIVFDGNNQRQARLLLVDGAGETRTLDFERPWDIRGPIHVAPTGVIAFSCGFPVTGDACLFDPDSGELTEMEPRLHFVGYSPDGHRALIEDRRDPPQVFVAPLADLDDRTLVGPGSAPTFSPDGQAVIWYGHYPDSFEDHQAWHVRALDGESQRLIARDREAREFMSGARWR